MNKNQGKRGPSFRLHPWSRVSQKVSKACIIALGSYHRFQVRHTRIQTHSSFCPKCLNTDSQTPLCMTWSVPLSRGRESGSGLCGGGRTTCLSSCRGGGFGGEGTSGLFKSWLLDKGCTAFLLQVPFLTAAPVLLRFSFSRQFDLGDFCLPFLVPFCPSVELPLSSSSSELVLKLTREVLLSPPSPVPLLPGEPLESESESESELELEVVLRALSNI